MPRKNSQREGPRESAVKALQAMQGERMAFSWREHTDHIRKGDKYGRYINGDPPARVIDLGKGKTDEALLTEAQKEARALGRGWVVVTHPFHGLTRSALKPSMVSKYGTWADLQKRIPDGASPEDVEAIEIFNGRTRIFRELAIKIDHTSQTKQCLLACVDDALQYGNGYLEADFDDEMILGRIRWESTKRVFVDIEAGEDPLGELQRWRSVAWSMPIDEADYLLKKVWGEGDGAWAKKDHTFSPLEWSQVSAEGGTQELPSKLCKLVRVYKRGQSPYTEAADLDAATGEPIEPVGDDPVYANGKDEVLIFEAKSGLDQPGDYEFIARFPYPYPCDFPIEPLWLTDDNESFLKPSYYQPSHSACIAANTVIRSYVSKVVALSRTIVGYHSGSFNKKSFEQAFFGPDSLNLVDFAKAGDLTRAFQAMPIGEVPKDLQESIGLLKALFDESSAREVLEIEQRSHQPATNAALQDAQKQLRLDEMSDRVERCYQNVMEKALTACSMMMSAEDVAKHIGDEFMGWTPTPDGKRVSRYWDDPKTKDPRSLRERVTIKLEPRSVRFVNPEQELQNIERFTTKAMEFSAQVASANKENPQLAAAIARMANAALRDYADRLHLAHGQDLQIDVMAALTQPIQPEAQIPETSVEMSVGPGGTKMSSTGPMGDPALQQMHEMQARGMDVGAGIAARQQDMQPMMGGPSGP